MSFGEIIAVSQIIRIIKRALSCAGEFVKKRKRARIQKDFVLLLLLFFVSALVYIGKIFLEIPNTMARISSAHKNSSHFPNRLLPVFMYFISLNTTNASKNGPVTNKNGLYANAAAKSRRTADTSILVSPHPTHLSPVIFEKIHGMPIPVVSTSARYAIPMPKITEYLISVSRRRLRTSVSFVFNCFVYGILRKTVGNDAEANHGEYEIDN